MKKTYHITVTIEEQPQLPASQEPQIDWKQWRKRQDELYAKLFNDSKVFF